ncbi:MAG TPA: hypothetical protein VGE74_10960 [Gemmata sp.]
MDWESGLPFQPAVKKGSGCPHERDQFVSIAASGWAALAFALK